MVGLERVMTPRCIRSSIASKRSYLCGALRLVASVQTAPRARLREVKYLLEGMSDSY